MTLFHDSETDGLLHELTKIHCICLAVDDGPVRRYHEYPELTPRDGTLAEALELVAQADETVAHNGIGFDIPAYQKVNPGWQPRGRVLDSLIVARTVWPDEHLKHLDDGRFSHRVPKHLRGRHSLEAWGRRLADHKGESPSSWKVFTPEMVDYCAQDVEVLRTLWRAIQKRQPTDAQIDLEQAFAQIIERMTARGFALSRPAAEALVHQLQARRAELDVRLREMFPPFEDVYFTPKKRIRKVRVVPFNPNSRQHIARALKEKHRWKPRKFTKTGQPKVDEAILKDLPYPEAQTLAERLMLKMRLGQIADGDQAWLKVVDDDGRVRGRVKHNAAVTGRCTHSRPNMSACPKMQKPWGPECRRCWVAAPGNKLVVVDAAGIDARMVAHYSARFDGGEFARLLLESDIHTRNAEVLGCARDPAKTTLYAVLFGAQGPKIGKILGLNPVAGTKKREELLRSLPGLGKLMRAVESDAKSRGWIRSLDGRRLWIRNPKAALNTLAQGGTAVVMKQAAVLSGRWAWDHLVMVVHDEMVMDVPADMAETCAAEVADATRRAGEHFNLRIPLEAHAGVGQDWTCK